MKRILVLGSTGFLGSHLVDKLVNENFDVIAQGRKLKKSTPKSVKERFVNIDFNKKNIDIGVFDVIINCISLLSSDKNLWDDYSISNCSITQKVLKNIPCEQFIQISSCSVFSDKSIISKYPYPRDLYGLSKYTSEKIVEIERKNKKSIILRFPIIVGKNKKSSDFIKHTIDKGLKGEDVELFDNGKYYRNILHISEAVNSIILAINSNIDNDYVSINIGSSNSLKMKNICQFLIDKFGFNSNIHFSDRKMSSNFDSFIDTSKASMINYNCISVKKNIQLLINEINNNV